VSQASVSDAETRLARTAALDTPFQAIADEAE